MNYKKEYKKGYDDAFYKHGYRPASIAYIDGYEKGKALRILLRPDPQIEE